LVEHLDLLKAGELVAMTVELKVLYLVAKMVGLSVLVLEHLKVEL